MAIREIGARARLVRRVAALSLVMFAAAVACTVESEPQTAATDQALGSGGSDSGSGSGSGSGGATPVGCAPKPVPTPNNASCLTADKTLWNVMTLQTAGTASGDYPIGIGQEGQPPPDAYRSDVCDRAWADCVNGHLLPQEATFCTNSCPGGCASPSVPGSGSGGTTWTVVPCGSIQCWHITCAARGCGAQVGCCGGLGSGS